MIQNTIASYRLFFITASFILILAGCSNQMQLPSQKKKTKNNSIMTALDAQKYKNNKEEVSKLRDIKKEMNNELPTNINAMSLEQLLKAKNYYIQLDYDDKAIIAIERAITLTTDQKILKVIRLELADLYFEQGAFEKAGKLYSIYLQHFPGSNQRKYVEYKATLCRFYQMLSADRDQSITKDTLALAEKYLQNNNKEDEFTEDVLSIKNQCLTILAEHEINVFQTHMKLYNYKGAENRLAYLKEHYAPFVEQDTILKMEITLAEKQGNDELVTKKNAELASLQNQKPSIVVAQRNRKNAVDIF